MKKIQSTKKRIAMQIAYENAYECQYFGSGRGRWQTQELGLHKDELDKIWRRATNDLANDKPCGFVYASKDDFSEIEETLMEEKAQ